MHRTSANPAAFRAASISGMVSHFIPSMIFSNFLPAASLTGFAITVQDEELVSPVRRDQLNVMRNEQEFDLGGYTVKMVALPGHTHGMMCALFAEDRVILFGDALNSAAFMQFDEALSIEEIRLRLPSSSVSHGPRCGG